MAWGVLLFMARAWTQLTAAVLLLLSARVLTPTEVGIFSLASALTIVLTQWVGVGTYEYIIASGTTRTASRPRCGPISVSPR